METKFQWRIVLIICSCMIADLFALEMTYPFLVFMVEGFNIKSSIFGTGTLVGFIGSSFGIGQFMSGFFWGKLSDKYGRKRPLLVGLAGNAICMGLFGISKDIYMAAGLQFAQGVMNGNFGILFSVIQDSYEEASLGRAFGYVGLSYGIGLSLSTLLSGLTARPASSYPTVFGHVKVFVEYPFLLPCLVSTTYILIVWGITAFLLPETHDRSNKYEPIPESGEPNPALTIREQFSTDVYIPSNRLWTFLTFLLTGCMFLHWWCMFGFMQMLGVWTSLPTNVGGLSFSSLEIGVFFASWGFFLLPYYKAVWPKVLLWKDNSTGRGAKAWHLIRVGLILDVLHFSLYPFLNKLASHHRILMWIFLELVIMLGVFAINTYYLAVQMLINASVVPKINGSINGLVTTALALGKAIAPFTAGLLFTWSLNNRVFPLDFHLLFFVFAASQFTIFVLSFVATWIYPHTLKIYVS